MDPVTERLEIVCGRLFRSLGILLAVGLLAFGVLVIVKGLSHLAGIPIAEW